MSDILTVLGFMAFGAALAFGAWRRLEAEEHDVLHTHPKLVVTLIVCGSLILGVQAVGIRYGARALRLVESAVNPEGEIARRGADQQIVVVADIQAVSIAAAACARQHAAVEDVKACTITEVERLTGQPPILSRSSSTTTTRR